MKVKEKIGPIIAVIMIVGMVAGGFWAIYSVEAKRSDEATVDLQCVACCEAGNYKSLEKLSACASACKSIVHNLEKDTDTDYVPQHCDEINETFLAGVRCYGPF